MRKQKRKRNKGDEDEGTIISGRSSGNNGNPGGAVMQRLLSQSLGVTNVGRLFDLTERYNGPHMEFKTGHNAFSLGWSDVSGSPVNQDEGAATDITSGATDQLYPVTPSAIAFEDEYWPILDALLQSGIGSRQSTTMYEVVRYFAMTSWVLDQLSFVLNLNYLSTAFNWSLIAPYTGQAPPLIWELTSLFDANDVGITDRWRPLYSRLASKVLPPNFAGVLMQERMPYIGDPYGHTVRLQWTAYAKSVFDGVYTVDEFETYIDGFLDYLESDLKTCHNVLTTFLPFKVGPIITMFRGYDPVFEEIDFNSAVKDYPNFGTTTEPTNEHTITIGEDSENGDSLIYFHKGSNPILKSVVHTPIYDVYTPAADQIYVNVSFWNSGPVVIIDDQLSSVVYDGTGVSTDVAQRYTRYFPNRWIKHASSQSILEGKGKAGMLPSLVAREEVVRANRSYALWLFGLEAVRTVLAITGGSGVRTIQKTVAEVWKRTRS
jgi:hypothetical protein